MRINLISYQFNNSGIGNYSKGIYQALTKLEKHQVSKTQFNFPKSKLIIEKPNESESYNSLKIPFDNHLFFGYRNKKKLKKCEEYDVNHILGQTLSFVETNGSKVITVHDTIPFITNRNKIISTINKIKLNGIKGADHLITISKEAKTQITQVFDISPKEISVIYQGISENFRELNLEKNQEYNLKEKYDLPDDKDYILHVGRESPHKNVPTIVRALAKTDKDIHIIRAGSPGEGSNRLKTQKIISKENLESDVSFLGHVSSEDLVKIYNIADLFVFPSSYEGFGRPPLEAMACGTPVITSNTSSLPEVVGDAAIKVDPKDTEQLAKEIVRVLESPELQEEMKQKGLKRAGKFSWEKTAKETLEVYKEVLNNENTDSK